MSLAIVWVVLETSPEFGNDGAVVHASREGATAAARSIIEDYRSHSQVADEIDEILRAFDDAAAAPTADSFGAGDQGALFYVQVYSTHVQP